MFKANPQTHLALLDTLVELVECPRVVGQTLPPLLMFLRLLTHVEAGNALIKLALQLHSFLPLLQIINAQKINLFFYKFHG